jgi:hypothetical protein
MCIKTSSTRNGVRSRGLAKSPVLCNAFSTGPDTAPNPPPSIRAARARFSHLDMRFTLKLPPLREARRLQQFSMVSYGLWQGHRAAWNTPPRGSSFFDRLF